MCQNINWKSVTVLTLTVVNCINCPEQVSDDDLKFTTVLYSLTFTGENKMSVRTVLMKNYFKKFFIRCKNTVFGKKHSS